MLGNQEEIKNWKDALSELREGTPLETPTPLFKKLDLKDIVGESDPFSRLDLRVAKIIDVQDHPQADKLYVMQVDLGPLGKRTIVAGMKPYYPKEEILGKMIVLVTNLKPATIRGVESKGMLLAAGDSTGAVVLLTPKESSPGAEVGVENIPREPVSVLEYAAFKEVVMTTDTKGHIIYNGKPLKSKNHNVVTDKKVKEGAKIS